MFIGALLALGLTNNSLNIFTIPGIIMLVDFTNHRKAAGETTFKALIEANHVRLSPILRTTIAMVFGMLPIALASRLGAEWKNGLAWVIIDGLMEETYVPAESEDGFTPVHVV